ncbi:MAG TPA: MFS transporter, partial [Elusimicrobiales bacterium]|nr:MFS transporter [Elusimicrobiales bacterium]
MLIIERRALLPVAAAALAVFIANLDASIIIVALPELAATFGASVSGIAWLSLAYLIACASFLLVFGRLGDAWGAERLLKYSYFFFGLVSVFCAAAPDLGWLIIFRFFQGISAAGLLATALAAVSRNVTPEMLGRALGAVSVFGAMGFAAGPPAGGFIVEHLGWRWLFVINVPIAAIGCYAVSMLRRHSEERRKLILDMPGAVLSCCALGFLVYAVSSGLEKQPPALQIAAWAAAVIFSLLFVRRERVCSDPLVPAGLFKGGGAGVALAACASAIIAVDGSTFTLPFFLGSGAGFSPSKTGLIMSALPLTALF